MENALKTAYSNERAKVIGCFSLVLAAIPAGLIVFGLGALLFGDTGASRWQVEILAFTFIGLTFGIAKIIGGMAFAWWEHRLEEHRARVLKSEQNLAAPLTGGEKTRLRKHYSCLLTSQLNGLLDEPDELRPGAAELIREEIGGRGR